VISDQPRSVPSSKTLCRRGPGQGRGERLTLHLWFVENLYRSPRSGSLHNRCRRSLAREQNRFDVPELKMLAEASPNLQGFLLTERASHTVAEQPDGTRVNISEPSCRRSIQSYRYPDMKEPTMPVNTKLRNFTVYSQAFQSNTHRTEALNDSPRRTTFSGSPIAGIQQT